MSIKKNLIYNTIYQVFVLLLPIITVPYVSRVLGPDGVGLYSYTNSYAQYFVLFGMMGISLYGNRQVAYCKNDKKKLSDEFSNIYGLQLITTTTSAMIYVFLFCIINDNNRVIYLIQLIIIIGSILDISWFFIGYEDMKSVVIRNSVVKLIAVICVFVFVNQKGDIWKYSLIMGVSGLVGQGIMWMNISDKVKLKKPNLRKSINKLKPALALFISQLAIQIYTLLDKTMLGYMIGVEEVGLYENSQKTIKLALTLITSLGVVMLPRMSALYSEGNVCEIKEKIKKSFGFVNFIAFPMMFGLISISDTFSIWFYGESFSGINNLLKIGSVLMIAIGWSNILGIQVMLPMKKEKQFTISVFVGALVNFILNLLLIKNLGAIGTTFASVVAELAVTCTQIYFLINFINIREIIKTMFKPFIGAIFMFAVLNNINWLFEANFFGTIKEVILGGVIYVIGMYVLREQFLMDFIHLSKKILIKRRK